MEEINWENYRITLPNADIISASNSLSRTEILKEVFKRSYNTQYKNCKIQLRNFIIEDDFAICLLQYSNKQRVNYKNEEDIDIHPKKEDDWYEELIIINCDENYQLLSISKNRNKSYNHILHALFKEIEDFMIQNNLGYKINILPLPEHEEIANIIKNNEINLVKLISYTSNFYPTEFTKEANEAYNNYNAKMMSITLENKDEELELKSHINEFEQAISGVNAGELKIHFGSKDVHSNKIKIIYKSEDCKNIKKFKLPFSIWENIRKTRGKSFNDFKNRILDKIKEFIK